jgi:hypothetical protein
MMTATKKGGRPPRIVDVHDPLRANYPVPQNQALKLAEKWECSARLFTSPFGRGLAAQLDRCQTREAQRLILGTSARRLNATTPFLSTETPCPALGNGSDGHTDPKTVLVAKEGGE